MSPVQQLGAAPGTPVGVPGFEGTKPVDDEELSPDYVATRADINAREAMDVLLVGIDEGIDREYAGLGAGIGREEAVNGSNPGFPAIPPAILAQAPGHIGLMPAERATRTRG